MGAEGASTERTVLQKLKEPCQLRVGGGGIEQPGGRVIQRVRETATLLVADLLALLGLVLAAVGHDAPRDGHALAGRQRGSRQRWPPVRGNDVATAVVNALQGLCQGDRGLADEAASVCADE